MKKRENKLQKLYSGDTFADLPLSLSLLSLPAKHNNDDKMAPRLTACPFYRAQYYHCGPFPKKISRIIDPTLE